MRCVLALLALVQALSVRASPHVAGYERLGGGAVLYSELGCANCHGGSAVVVERSGPVLANLVNRIDFAWAVDFLKNPEEAHRGSTMPRMTHGLGEDDIRSIALFLGSLQKGSPLRSQRHVNPARGRELYQSGCVACHAPVDSPREGAGWAVAFPDLRRKYALAGLDHFLSHVSNYRRDGRMPHITLTRHESLDLAGHLLGHSGSDPREAQPHRPWPKATKLQLERGKALVTRLNCAACHDLPGVDKPARIPIESTSGDCIGDAPRQGTPWYPITAKQRMDLVAFLLTGASQQDDTLIAMNCVACHVRGEIGGPVPQAEPFFIGEASLGDSGRLPPPLTGIGHKLRSDWLVGALAGHPHTRVRPYLKARMPRYPEHAKELAAWLAKSDHKPNAAALPDLPDAALDAGRKLLSANGGVNCVTCHNWQGHKSPGIPGLDISALDQRLRPQWFREYLLNPAAYRPGTLMPSLWPDGKSSVPDVLGGDAQKQIAAIWHFIAKGEGVPEGYRDRSGGEFELVPSDRPIIQRTFLKNTGTKAILVGFPEGVHLAFDGGSGRPSLLWQGKFFDAYSTWFTRAAPFENPLGEDVVSFPATAERLRFRGYVLDDKGNPEFLLERAGVSIREHYRAGRGRLIRTITWEQGEVPVAPVPAGMKVEVTESKGRRVITYLFE